MAESSGFGGLQVTFAENWSCAGVCRRIVELSLNSDEKIVIPVVSASVGHFYSASLSLDRVRCRFERLSAYLLAMRYKQKWSLIAISFLVWPSWFNLRMQIYVPMLF